MPAPIIALAFGHDDTEKILSALVISANFSAGLNRERLDDLHDRIKDQAHAQGYDR